MMNRTKCVIYLYSARTLPHRTEYLLLYTQDRKQRINLLLRAAPPFTCAHSLTDIVPLEIRTLWSTKL